MDKSRRRTQEERTAETRVALMEATVSTLHRLGYAGATTAIIAETAGVSRGALTHHFDSRTHLMAATVQWVYDRELEQYAALVKKDDRGDHVADWPELLWEVLSKPGGVATLEILQAMRSDHELAERVRPVQMAIEQASVEAMRLRFGGDERMLAGLSRLMVWTIRGLTIERLMVADVGAVQDAVAIFRLLLKRGAPSGAPGDLLPALYPSPENEPSQDR